MSNPYRPVNVQAAKAAIYDALASEEWEFRTIGALARAADTDESTARDIVNSMPEVRAATHTNNELYTLKG